MYMKLILMLLILLASCSPELSESVEIILAEEHPYESVADRAFSYTLYYFDGKRTGAMHMPAGTRRARIAVRKGSLSVFAAVPEGDLGPIGGFYEGDGPVLLKCEDGSFAQMLIRAAEYRREAVERLSVRNLKASYPYLPEIDETAFLEDLFDGTLTASSVKTAEAEPRCFSAIPRGQWMSERYDIPSFEVAFTARPVYLMLRPGVYRFANWEKELLLTVAVDEKGESSASVTALPLT